MALLAVNGEIEKTLLIFHPAASVASDPASEADPVIFFQQLRHAVALVGQW